MRGHTRRWECTAWYSPLGKEHNVLKKQAIANDELVGYVDYAAKVRYRLIPGIW